MPSATRSEDGMVRITALSLIAERNIMISRLIDQVEKSEHRWQSNHLRCEVCPLIEEARALLNA